MIKAGKTITVSKEIGPIQFLDSGCIGIDHEYEFMDSIFVREKITGSQRAAFLELTLRKDVFLDDEAEGIHDELKEALRNICYSWEWAGGGRISTEEMAIKPVLHYKTNINLVHEEFQSESATKINSARFSNTVGLVKTYKNYPLPLQKALTICRAMRTDEYLQKMLKYFHSACENRLTWFMDLHNIGDVLKERFSPNPKRVISELGIPSEDWSFFERRLNPLRHAPKVRSINPPITGEDRAKLFSLARAWITAYMSRIKL